jgi:hypothetical protein
MKTLQYIYISINQNMEIWHVKNVKLICTYQIGEYIQEEISVGLYVM